MIFHLRHEMSVKVNMPVPIFVNDNFYHIFNRGVEKRIIFNETNDYLRFVRSLFEFNDELSVEDIRYQIFNDPIKELEIRRPRKLLVDIACFCLMPNHFHLVLNQLKEGGISKFMQKLGNGYTKYFNTKYERSGVLFQGTFKTVPILTDAQLLHISRYIHLNPVELIESQWKERGVEDWRKVQKFLESYQWSSYLDYIGQKNFSYLVNPRFISEQFKSAGEYKKFIKIWVIKDANEIEDLILE